MKISNKLKKLSKNKDVKTLTENFVSLSLLRIVGLLLPLITLPYVLRVLGKSNYGIIVLATTLINYFTALTDYSFRITATRDVAINKNDKKQLDLIYSNVLTVRMLFCILSTIIILLIVLLYKPFRDEITVFSLTIPMLFGYVLFPEWFFRGIEKMRYITYLNLGIKTFFTICIFVFIHEVNDYWMYPLFNSLGFIGAGIVGQSMLTRKYKLKYYWIGTKRIKKVLKNNFPIFINQFLPTLYNNTSSFLLGIMAPTYMLGIYDAIKKVVELFYTFANIIATVFFPFLNRVKNAFNKYKKAMLIIGVSLTLIPIVSYKLIFWYLDINNNFALPCLILLSVSVFFVILYDIFGLNFFIVHNQDKLVMRNTIYASVIGFILAFPLIHYWGIIGAALNLVISRGIMGLGLTYKYSKSKVSINKL
ncbi:MAG: oligosaccharide flippase family protein [Bacteroidales bacterium]